MFCNFVGTFFLFFFYLQSNQVYLLAKLRVESLILEMEGPSQEF
jgi:hypothetical protein